MNRVAAMRIDTRHGLEICPFYSARLYVFAFMMVAPTTIAETEQESTRIANGLNRAPLVGVVPLVVPVPPSVIAT